MSNEIIVKEYLGSEIEFKMIEGNIYANATSIANAFDNGRQKLADWKRSKRTIELIEELSTMENSHRLIISEEGRNGGTWIEENLILDFAQYLNIKFRVWCNTQITTLIREGEVSLKPKTEEDMLLMLFPDTNPDLIMLSAGNIRLIKKQSAQLEEQKPMVEFANNVANASNSIDIGELAKIISNDIKTIGRTKLFSYLRENGFLMKGNIPYQKYIDNGYFKVVEGVYKTPYGDKTYSKTLCTGKGQIAIIEKIKSEIK